MRTTRMGLVITAAMLVAFALPARAGLDLTWNACNRGPGAASNLAPACASGAPLQLFGSFQVAADVGDVTDFLVTLDLQSAGGSLPPFWAFHSGGCNQAGLQFGHVMPTSVCPTALHTTRWSSSVNELVDVVPDPQHSDRVRINLRLYWPIQQPRSFLAGVNYFGFLMTIAGTSAQEAGGACAGCTAPMVVTWSGAQFIRFTGLTTIVAEPGFASNCATVNDAGSGLCAATPARRTTWGAIKSLYR